MRMVLRPRLIPYKDGCDPIVIARFRESQDSQTRNNFFLSYEARSLIMRLRAISGLLRVKPHEATYFRRRSVTHGEKKGFQNHR